MAKSRKNAHQNAGYMCANFFPSNAISLLNRKLKTLKENRLKGIHKRFGPVHANNDINVTFSAGRIVGVLGENGAGKSTLMKILSGFQPADEGEIWVDGAPVKYDGPQAAIAHGVGMLQQDPLDVGAFNVLENFTYGGGGGFFLNKRRIHQQFQDVCQRLRFELDPESPIEQLTVAQRQQLEIVRLLAKGINTLILDEPTTGISADQKDLLFDTLRSLARTDGMIVLLVSHKLEDVIALCDEIVVLRAGNLVGALDMPAE
jgi:simple sugar transport system ATP-binding protein